MNSIIKLLAAFVFVAITSIPSASADSPVVRPADDAFDAILSKSAGGKAVKGSVNSVTQSSSPYSGSLTPKTRYAYRTACGGGIGFPATGAPVCPANTCPPGQDQFRLWQVAPPPQTPLGLVCSGAGAPPPPPAPAQAAAPPQVTDAMVLEAFRRVPLPGLRSQAQPAAKTLVNFETIFHTDAPPLERQVTLLGQQVRLQITARSFTWSFGDGTSTTTTAPGAPYPARDVVHRYTTARVTVEHHVTITWGARWSLGGGPLRPVVGTVTTTGPSTPLRVAEATPVLSGRDH